MRLRLATTQCYYVPAQFPKFYLLYVFTFLYRPVLVSQFSLQNCRLALHRNNCANSGITFCSCLAPSCPPPSSPVQNKMSELKIPRVSNEETKERVEVELHELSEGSLVEGKYMGTDADRHDMVVLGRRQVLRVGKAWLSTPKSTWRCANSLLSANIVIFSAIFNYFLWLASPLS